MKPFLCYTIFLTLLIAWASPTQAQYQHVWEKILNRETTTNELYHGEGFFLHETNNQEYVLMTTTTKSALDSGNVRWIVLDNMGQMLQEKKFATPGFPNTYIHQSVRQGALRTSDGGYAFVEITGVEDDSIALNKLDANGNLLWQQIYASDTTMNTIFFTSRLQELNNGDYLILKEYKNPVIGNDYRIEIQRVSSTGVPIWKKRVYNNDNPSPLSVADFVFEQNNGRLIRIIRDGRGYIKTYDGLGNPSFMTVTSTAGNTYTTNIIPIDTGSNGLTASNRVIDAIQTTDDGLLVLTNQYLIKFDSSLQREHIETVGFSNFIGPTSLPLPITMSAADINTTSDGGYILAVTSRYGYNSHNHLFKLDANLNLEWQQALHHNTPYFSAKFNKVIQTSDNGYLLAGKTATSVWVVKTDSLGRYKTNHIQGNVFTDYDQSCTIDSTDIALQDVILRFKSTTTQSQYYAKTDSNGFYNVAVPRGTYNIQLNSPFPFFDTLCPLDSTIVFLAPDQTDTFDIPLSPTISCPMPTVHVSAAILRRGLPSYYVANYCNHGTADAQGVYIEIELDSYFNLDSTSSPFANQNGNIYTFNIGNLNVGDCGQIYLYGTIDTAAIFGQTHCTEARIFPDSVCIPNLWNGPIMQASSSCQNDSVQFSIKNVGGATATNHSYWVYEDHVIFSISNVSLGIGADTHLSFPAAPGKTYRLEVAQANGFPPILGSPKAVTFQEGCHADNNGLFNTSFVTQFYNGNSSPFISLDCTRNRGSWDPNDKQAQPQGYGNMHYIEPNTPITYKIRFQNTGTDTAFRVVLIDTLSQHLDPATLQIHVASHNYTWQLSSQGVLQFFFDNIMLPDSNVNELASHGFVEFSIQQKPNLPIGTTITNQAAIYFDFNAPVITNETYHTIEENFVSIVLTQEAIPNPSPNLKVTISPNPFKEHTTVWIEGTTKDDLNLNIYDLTGKRIAQYPAVKKAKDQQTRIPIQRKNLIQGIYFYQLESNGKIIKAGKMIVH